MSMVTSCPSCATTFRVTQDQLKLRQGRVRCGKCAGVFDAFKTLASLPDEPLPEPLPRRIEDEASADAGGAFARQAVLDIEPVPAARWGRSDAGLAGTADRREASARSRRIWAGAIGVLCLLLVLQLAYALRASLASAMPRARPLFQALCALTGCTLSWPKRTDVLAIEASDLQADPARPQVIVLTAALRNRGNAVVAHPALELTLTNAQDQAIARRVFLPRDYLERPAEAASGMAAAAEINVRIELDTGDLKPAGYRLFLFYP
jgi:predicted Zn finger-like uncharacterized protein